MRGENLIKTGRIIIIFALTALAIGLPLRAAVLETRLDDGAIEGGDSTTLRVKLPGDTSDVKPVKYPSVPGLRIEYSGMQRSFQYINGKSFSGVELLFSVTGLKRGTYRIPSFSFRRGNETLRSGEVSLSVAAGSSGETGAAADVKTSVELSATTAYAGQPVIMRYYILSTGMRATVRGFEHTPDTKGFVTKMIDSAGDAAVRDREGDYDRSLISTFALIPATAGVFQVGGGNAILSVETAMRNRRDDFFGFGFPSISQERSIGFDTKPITILPLPRAGVPGDFHGDIGNFTMRAEYSADGITVFGEKKILVTVEGSGNLVTMTKPHFVRETAGLKVISEDGESSVKIDKGAVRGSRKFIFTLIPEKAGTCDTGGLALSFFNPDAGRYQTISTKNISFAVKGDGSKPDAKFDRDAENKVEFNPLYFVLIAFAVAGAVVFVAVWERKRYRIVAERDEAAGKNEPEPARVDDRDYITDMSRCLAAGDGNGFLKSAEKLIDRMRSDYGGPVPRELDRAMAGIKEKIYGYKFGGGSISSEEMKKIRQDILELAAR